MINKSESACLVIADISGYTDYLAGVELDHAQDILADLVATVVGGLRPTFRLAKLEGDAAFAYVAAQTVDGSLLQDVVERTYLRFRRRLRDIGRASRCECSACIRMPSLDLKFVIHHGLVVRQKVAGREELVGRDVILVHRLLKNAVEAQIGRRAYALYTADCIAAMGIDDPHAQGLQPHRETIDVIGDVDGWVRDLEAVWQADQQRAANVVAADRAYWRHVYRLSAPPAVAWEYVTSPVHRPRWGGMTMVNEVSPAGRRGPGTVNHCVHGRDVIIEEVLDWAPFESFTTRYTVPIPGAPKIVMTDVFTPLDDGGTEVEIRIAAPKPRERAQFERVVAGLAPDVEAAAHALEALVAAEIGERSANPAPEPALPDSPGRYLAEPVGARAGSVDSADGRSSLV